MNHIAIVGGCGHVGFPLGLALAQRLGNSTKGGGGVRIVS